VVRQATCDFGAVRAVDHVDLDLAPGSITALVGPNGAGKSTLLSAVAGDVSIDGSIALDDVDLTRRSPEARARLGVARCHQHVRLIDDMTALDSVMVGVDLDASRTPRRDQPTEAERREMAHRWLAALNADHLADERIADLSFVERRFVDVARLFATRPRLALLDEPSAGLDPDERAQLVDAFSRLHAAGCTVLLVEHDLAFVRALAHEVVALVDGRVLATGEPDVVFALPAFENAYLGGTVQR